MATETKPTQASVRAEIEGAQREFHELINSLSDEDWKKKTPNESWRVDQLMWHTAWGNEFIPKAVADCRKGGGFYPPQWLFGWVNPWITRIGARGATKESVKAKYDAGMTKVLACLETIKDDEWEKSMDLVGRTETIHSLLLTPVRHLEEHKADVLKGIGRG
jgi:hypothetical protein